MVTSQLYSLFGGIFLGVFFIPVIYYVFKFFIIEVKDNENVIVVKHGKLATLIKTAGPHIIWDHFLPWTKCIFVSLKKKFYIIENIHVNDVKGTTMTLDLFVEYKIKDPLKAVFQIDNYKQSMINLITHSSTAYLSHQDFEHIIKDREELCACILSDLVQDFERWGIVVENLFIKQVRIPEEVAQQIFDKIAARLNHEKAKIEEMGQIASATLSAQTEVKIAELNAKAKAQYPIAIGAAYEKLKKDQDVLCAYQKLYELSLIRPHRTIAFSGFSEHELTPDSASMMSFFSERNNEKNIPE